MLLELVQNKDSIFNALLTSYSLNIFDVFLTDYLDARPRYNNLNNLLSKKSTLSDMKSSTLADFLINPDRLHNIDLLNISLLNPSKTQLLYKMYGIHTLYIYLPTLLYFFWFIFFFLLGFIATERNRIIWLLLMLLGTALFLLLGLYWSFCLIEYTRNCFLNTGVYDSLYNHPQAPGSQKVYTFVNLNEFKKLYAFADIFTEYLKFLPKNSSQKLQFLGSSQPLFYFKKLNLINFQINYTLSKQSLVLELPSYFQTSMTSVYMPTHTVNPFPKLNNYGNKFNFGSNSYNYFVRSLKIKRINLNWIVKNSSTTFWDPTWNDKYNSPYMLRRFRVINDRLSIEQKTNLFLIFIMSIKSSYNLFSLNSLVIIFAICVGPTLTVIGSCIGLNYRVTKYRSSLWIYTKYLKKRKRLDRFKFKYLLKYIYRRFGGTAAMEFSSVEREHFTKKIQAPANSKERYNFLFWYRQLQKSVYSRVPTTLIWFSMVLGFLAFPSNHPQWRFLAPLLLFFFSIVYFRLHLHFPLVLSKIKLKNLYNFINFLIPNLFDKKQINHFHFYKNVFVTLRTVVSPNPALCTVAFVFVMFILYFFCFFYFNHLSFYAFNCTPSLRLWVFVLVILMFLFLFFLFNLRNWIFKSFFSFLQTNFFIYFDAFLFLFVIFSLFPIFIIAFIKLFNYWFTLKSFNFIIIFTYLFLTGLTYFIFNNDFLKNKLPKQFFTIFYLLSSILFYTSLCSFWSYFFSKSFIISILLPLICVVYVYGRFSYTILVYHCFVQKKNNCADDLLNLQQFVIFIYFMGALGVLLCFFTKQFNFFIFFGLLLIVIISTLKLYTLIRSSTNIQFFYFVCDTLFCVASTSFVLFFVNAQACNPLGCTFFPTERLGGFFFLVCWAWSYLRLWRQLCFFKSINLFFYWFLVILPIVSFTVFNLRFLYHIHFLERYASVILLLELFFIFYKFCNTSKNIQTLLDLKFLTSKGTNISRFVGSVKSLRVVFIIYTTILYLIFNFIVLSCNFVTISNFFSIFICIFIIAFCGACVVTAISSTIRTGFTDDLLGSLSNFRFIKRLFNILILLSFILILIFLYFFALI